MAIELTPPVIYATPGELAEAYMPEVERLWAQRAAFSHSIQLPLPDQIRERQDAIAFWGQVQKRLPEGWALYDGNQQDWTVRLFYGYSRRVWPDHDAWAS